MATYTQKLASVKALRGNKLTKQSVVSHLLTLGVAFEVEAGNGNIAGKWYFLEDKTRIEVCWADYTSHVFGAKSQYKMLGYVCMSNGVIQEVADPIAFLAFGK